MAEFDINGVKYRSGKLNAFQQFHVARRIAPLLSKFGSKLPTVDSSRPLDDLLAPVVDALAMMPDEDCNYVLQRCLSVVNRHQGNNVWAPVWNEPAKRLQFEDIDMTAMMQIAMQVLGDNLANFINAPSSTSLPQASTESNTPGNLSAFPTTRVG